MRFVGSILLAMVAACGGGSSNTDLRADMSIGAAGDQALYSLCGHPGDPGNALGVGKFCMSLADCTNSVCSTVMSIPQGPTYFCTVPCSAGDSSACGADATCTCLSASACGCVPNSCRVGLFG